MDKRMWTEEEDRILRERLDDLRVDQISELLGRSKSSVYGRMERLGLKARVAFRWGFQIRVWDENDKNQLIFLAGVWPVDEIAKKLKRSRHAIESQAARMGVSLKQGRVTADQIGELFGMSRQSIIRNKHRSGQTWGNQRRGKALFYRNPSIDEIQQLAEFVLEKYGHFKRIDNERLEKIVAGDFELDF